MALTYPAPCSSHIDKIDVFVSHACGSLACGNDVNGTYIQVYMTITNRHPKLDTPFYCLFPCLDQPIVCSAIINQTAGDKLRCILVTEANQRYYGAAHINEEPQVVPTGIVEQSTDMCITCPVATSASNFVQLYGHVLAHDLRSLTETSRYFACLLIIPDDLTFKDGTCIVTTSWFTPIVRDAAYKQLIAGLPHHDTNACETIALHPSEGRRFIGPLAPLTRYLFGLTPGGGPSGETTHGDMRQALIHAKKGAVFVPTISNRVDQFKTDVYVADADYDSIGDVPCTTVVTPVMKSEFCLSGNMTRLKFNVSCIRHVQFRDTIKQIPSCNTYLNNSRSLYFTGALNALECPNRTIICTNGSVCIDATAQHTVDILLAQLCVIPTVCGCHLFMTQPYNLLLDEPKKIDIMRQPLELGANTLVMFFDAMIRVDARSSKRSAASSTITERSSYPVVCMAVAKDNDTETRFYIIDITARSLFGDVWSVFVYDMNTPIDFISMNCTRSLFQV